MAQTDLAAETDTAAGVLVTQLNPLEGDGLVARRRDPRDRRRHLVVLTDTGRQRLRAAAAAQQDRSVATSDQTPTPQPAVAAAAG